MRNVKYLMIGLLALTVFSGYSSATSNITYEIHNPYENSKGNVIENFSTVDGWTLYNSTGQSISYCETRSLDGDGSLHIQVDGNKNAFSMITTNITAANLSNTNNIAIWFYVDNRSTFKKIEIRLSSVTTGSHYYYARVYQNARTGWNSYVIARDRFTAIGREDWNMSQVQLKVLVYPVANTTTSIYFDRLTYGYTAQPTLIFGIDDGNATVYDIAYPIMKKYNIPGTFFVITGRVNNSDSCTLDELHDLDDSGWDISSHTQNHTQLTILSGTNLNTQLKASQNWLVKNGFGGGQALQVSYPNGLYNDNVIDSTDNYYLLGRTTITTDQDAHIQNMSKSELMTIKHFEVYSNTSTDIVNETIDNTIKQNGMLFLTFHAFSEAGNETNYYYSRQKFENICAYVASKSTIKPIVLSSYIRANIPNNTACFGETVRVYANGSCTLVSGNTYPAVIVDNFKVIPFSTVDITVTANNSNSKAWNEVSIYLDNTVQYIIGGFTPNAEITIFRDNNYYATVSSNNTGFIDWTHQGGCSKHTFSTVLRKSQMHTIGGFTPNAEIAIYSDNFYYTTVFSNNTGFIDWAYTGRTSDNT